MPDKAFAVVATKPGTVDFAEVTIRDPSSEDVIVKVSHSWISPGTERSFIMGERLNGETPRQPDDPLPFPLISGYQKVGTLEWVGADVPDLTVGMQVFASVSKVEGMHFDHAGHISPSVVHHSQVWQLPDTPSPIAYSGLVLTQVGFNCGMRGHLSEGDIAVVIGDGLVGQWAAQTLAHRKAQVLLVGRHAYRLKLFTDFAHDQAASVIDITRDELVAAIQKITTSGIQLVVDSVGAMDSVRQLMPLMNRNGHIVSAGFLGNDGLIDIQKLRYRELSLHAPSGWVAGRIADTMNLIANGVLETQNLITHQFPVMDAKRAFDLILHRQQPSLGVVLDWSELA